jgi:hypothetical protein
LCCNTTRGQGKGGEGGGGGRERESVKAHWINQSHSFTHQWGFVCLCFGAQPRLKLCVWCPG